MAIFETAYVTYIKPNEGGYAFVPGDKGGETYAGIARNYNPTWGGWTFIDYLKRTKGPISNNTTLPEIQYLVDDFYKTRWNANRFGEIKSQEVANLLFDFHVHSQSTAIKTIQAILGIGIDGVMGSQTIAAINAANPAKLHDDLKAARKEFLESLVLKDPTQQKFYDGWMARMAKFPTLVQQNVAPILALLAVCGFAAGIYYYAKKNELKLAL